MQKLVISTNKNQAQFLCTGMLLGKVRSLCKMLENVLCLFFPLNGVRPYSISYNKIPKQKETELLMSKIKKKKKPTLLNPCVFIKNHLSLKLIRWIQGIALIFNMPPQAKPLYAQSINKVGSTKFFEK